MDHLLTARIMDLDETAYSRNITKNTGFLTASEQSEIFAFEKKLMHPGRFFSGGYPAAERQMLIWPADYENTEELPERLIACIKAEPLSEKYAEELSHRDYLGALMNLGIERDRTGDILIKGKSAYIFCAASLAEMIAGELTRVKHTQIRAQRTELKELDAAPALVPLKVNVASERIDAVLAAFCHLSRAKAAELIGAEKVFADGRLVVSAGDRLKCGARVSVRGFGKFIYDGIENESRKSRLFVQIRKYV